jgi:[ribosomal protein S5]-alanine N-acetyltransferase
MLLETKRCALTKLQASDYDNVRRLYVNEEVRKYLGGAWTEEEAITGSFHRMLASQEGASFWIIREKQTNAFIGLISLDMHHDGVSTEVSYELLPEWWGSGYAAETVTAVIDYAFRELGLPEVIAETQAANKASCRLLERIGMSFRDTVQRFGEQQAIYGITNREIVS